jgi:hypothetical protein
MRTKEISKKKTSIKKKAKDELIKKLPRISFLAPHTITVLTPSEFLHRLQFQNFNFKF